MQELQGAEQAVYPALLQDRPPSSFLLNTRLMFAMERNREAAKSWIPISVNTTCHTANSWRRIIQGIHDKKKWPWSIWHLGLGSRVSFWQSNIHQTWMPNPYRWTMADIRGMGSKGAEVECPLRQKGAPTKARPGFVYSSTLQVPREK